MCKNLSKKCYPLISNNAFSAKKLSLLNMQDKSSISPSKYNGIIISGIGEPVNINGQYFLHELSFKFYCTDLLNSTTTLSSNQNVKLIKDANIPNYYHIEIKYNSFYGCPSTSATKYTRPNYSNYVIKPSINSSNKMIANFSLLNSKGLYGIRTPIKIRSKAYKNLLFSKKIKNNFATNEKHNQKYNYFLFYQPSERIYCPFSKACDNNQISSAWVCDHNFEKCTDFGVYSNKTKYEKLNSSSNLFKITHFQSSSGRQIEVTLSCNSSFPAGHIKFDKEAELIDNKQLILKGQASDICTEKFTHKKAVFSNQTRFIFEEGDYKIDLDISNYNYIQSNQYYYLKKSQNSIVRANKADIKYNLPQNFLHKFTKNLKSWKVNVTSYGPVHFYDLYYQPSIEIPCPEGNNCVDDENSTIWLCHSNQCKSYGNLQNGLESSLASIGGMTGGVSVTYKGSQDRRSIITFECSRSNDVFFRLPTGIDISSDYTLYFSVGAREACPFSDNPESTPLPSVHIPLPKTVNTTITPNPSPDPFFFVRNSTHYTKLEFDKFFQRPFRGNVPILVDGEFGAMYSEFSPWELLPCPSGWSCPNGEYANLWGCWEASKDEVLSSFFSDDSNFTIQGQIIKKYKHGNYNTNSRTESIANRHKFTIKSERDVFNRHNFALKGQIKNQRGSSSLGYCHPIGDKRLCAVLTPLAPNELGRGVMLKYCGSRGIFAELKIDCDSSTSPSLLSLHSSSSIFHRSLNGPYVSYDLSSSLICPTEFTVIPLPPSPAPPPLPSTDPNASIFFSGPPVNGTHVVLDMTTFRQSEQWTVFGELDRYELSFLVFNPARPVGCPRGFSCADATARNVWKCGRDLACVAMGDARYGVTFRMNDQTDPSKGVSVVYTSGYRFVLNLACDLKATDKLLEFDEVNRINSSEMTVYATVKTSFVCPVPVDDGGSGDALEKTSIGAMVLLAMLVAAILYLAVGALVVFLRKGVIEVPNLLFWREFALCVKTAFVFLVTCGNTEGKRERKKYSGI